MLTSSSAMGLWYICNLIYSLSHCVYCEMLIRWNQSISCALPWVTIARDSVHEYPFYPVGQFPRICTGHPNLGNLYDNCFLSHCSFYWAMQLKKCMPSGLLAQEHSDWAKLSRQMLTFLAVYSSMNCSLDQQLWFEPPVSEIQCRQLRRS